MKGSEVVKKEEYHKYIIDQCKNHHMPDFEMLISRQRLDRFYREHSNTRMVLVEKDFTKKKYEFEEE